MKTLVMLFLLSFTMLLWAQETDSLNAKTEYRSDDLQVFFALINDPGFFEEWEKPEPPRIAPIQTYKRGDQVIPIILFGTDRVDSLGKANLTYDITITKPSGEIYGEFKQLRIWDGPVKQLMYLLKQPVAIYLEKTDPLGKYTVAVKIYENVKKQVIDLKLCLEVVE